LQWVAVGCSELQCVVGCCSVLLCAAVCLSLSHTNPNEFQGDDRALFAQNVLLSVCVWGGGRERESTQRGRSGGSAHTLPERQHQSLRCNAYVMPNPQLHPHPHPHQRQHVQPLLYTHTHMSTFVAFWMPLQYTFLPLTSIRQSPGTIPQLHADEPSTSACES